MLEAGAAPLVALLLAGVDPLVAAGADAELTLVKEEIDSIAEGMSVWTEETIDCEF